MQSETLAPAEDLDTAPSLETLDAYIQTSPEPDEAMDKLLDNADLRTRHEYYTYLKSTRALTEGLLGLQARLVSVPEEPSSVTLQQLAARTQSLVVENRRLHQSFTRGEEKFFSYQLMDKAIGSLADAVEYWQAADLSRGAYRGTVLDQQNDDEMVRTKLKAALQAIQELESIQKTITELDKQLKDEPQ